MARMSVELANGESALGTYGFKFASIEEARDYLARSGGGSIEILTEGFDLDEGGFSQEIEWEGPPEVIIVEDEDEADAHLWNSPSKAGDAALLGSHIVEAYQHGIRDFSQMNLHGHVHIQGVDLTGANFTGSRLTTCTFTDCNLTAVNFTDCNLTGAEFYNCNVTKARWDGANCTRAYLRETYEIAAPTFDGAITTDAVMPGQPL